MLIRRLLQLFSVIPLVALLIGLAVPVAADGGGVCLATIEHLTGQGRYTMGGLSRYTMGGLEGDDADLSTDSGLTPEQIAEIRENAITPQWLLDLLPTIATDSGFGGQKTAILIVDDFSDTSITLQNILQVPLTWLGSLLDALLTLDFPLTLPTVTHGELVEIELRQLLDAVKTQYASLDVSLHRVDISAAGNYQLHLVVPAIAAKVNELKLQGYTRFVLNMSFGLIPCESGSFDFLDFIEEREELEGLLGLLTDNFTLDVDGPRTSAQGLLQSLAPVVYKDAGLQEYLTDTLGSGAQGLLTNLLTSPLVQSTSSDPGIVALRALLQSYMAESATENGAKYVAVAASGNFADWITPDVPLSPASFPEVIAVGATLGENGERWEYSQAAHLLAPGAWFDYTGKESFAAGTSFSAPYVSMIAGLYLTYPASCSFDGAHPPLLSDAYANSSITWDYVGLDCAPGNEPFELLTNGGFEAPGGTGKDAGGWIGASLLGDKRVLKNARTGSAAFQFNGNSGLFSVLNQPAEVTTGFKAGDTLALSAWVKAKSLPVGAGRLQILVKYTDGTPKTKKNLPFPAGTYDYTQHTVALILASGNIKSVRVQVSMGGASGRFWVDDVSLLKPRTPQTVSGGNWLPLPPAP